jgi:hypothetical protein
MVIPTLSSIAPSALICQLNPFGGRFRVFASICSVRPEILDRHTEHIPFLYVSEARLTYITRVKSLLVSYQDKLC